ncbi:MAG: endo-1,4-beta-xylanase [Fibrobacter sp.]|nr:endo-1,4-beta-xylanase [Fibrobacter sp.]
MKKTQSLASKAIAVALAASSLSFAGPGLADGFAKFVGNITTRGQVRSDFGQYWNQITAENECKWASIEGSRGNRNFSGCKAAYNWAVQNEGHFKFHALVWGSQYPNWLNGLSVDDTKKAITDWFDAVKKEFPELEMIDVVNEAIRGGNGYHSGYGNGNNIIGALGGDNNGDYNFVVTAFKMARERWPDAILIYNDYNTVQWDKDGGINLINTIKKNGAPVDAYGLQAHDMTTQGGGAGGTGGGGNCLNINTLKSTIEEIWSKTQMPMFISEYDIGIADDNTQKKCYEEQISYFMENEHIAGITIWGYINGATWLDNSGIINDGRGDRAAMKWLKEYFGNESNKAKSQNTTGLAGGTAVDPEPQLPFKGTPHAIPGKIEIEDFDIPGKGKNEDGSYNTSFADNDSDNNGDSDYRSDTGVDLYKKATGIAAGYNADGDWLEYTVDIAKAGDYTVYVSAATPSAGPNFTLTLDPGTKDEKVIADAVEVLPSSSGDSEDYDDFQKVSAKVTLPAGQHILRFIVTKGYFDVDYMTFVEGDGADPEPIGGNASSTVDPANPTDPNGTTALPTAVKFNQNGLKHFLVFDQQGVRVGTPLSAYDADNAARILLNSSAVKNSGVYYLRDRDTGAMKAVRVVR